MGGTQHETRLIMGRRSAFMVALDAPEFGAEGA
jgi:hypothetical protein